MRERRLGAADYGREVGIHGCESWGAKTLEDGEVVVEVVRGVDCEVWEGAVKEGEV